MGRILLSPESPNSENGLKERWTHLNSVRVELMLPEVEEGSLKRGKISETRRNSKKDTIDKMQPRQKTEVLYWKTS